MNMEKPLDLASSYSKLVLAHKQGVSARLADKPCVCPYAQTEPRLRQAWLDGYELAYEID